MGTLSFVIIDAADPLPSAAQILAGLSGTGAPAIHAGQRSILCGRDAIAQKLVDKYGAGVWFDAADSQFGGAQALEGGLVDRLPNLLDRIERMHAVGHMGASWTGSGSTPPTVDGSATHMGADCVSATFAAADYGASGYSVSRAWPWGNDAYKYFVTQGTRAVVKARIAVSRDLQSGEVVTMRSGGGGGLPASSYGDLEAGQWYELVADAGTPVESGGYRNGLIVYPSGDHSAPLTVYVQEHTIWEHSDSALTQATTSQQPRFVRASNGLPAIQGDGVDDFLAGEIALPGTSLWTVAALEIPSPYMVSPPTAQFEAIWGHYEGTGPGPGSKGRRLALHQGDTTFLRALVYGPEGGASSAGLASTYNGDGGVRQGAAAVVALRRGGGVAHLTYWTRPDGSKSAPYGGYVGTLDNVPDRAAIQLLAGFKSQRYRGRVLGAIIGTTAISDADLSDLYDLAAAYYKVI